MWFAPQRRALFQRLNFQKWCETDVFCTFWLGHVLCATTACTFSTSQLPKVVCDRVFCTFWLGHVLRATTACTFSTWQLPKVIWEWCVLYILTWKCGSHQNGVHFSDVWTSKSGPRPTCFVHFDLDMYFAPQRRALFRHLNFQKWFVCFVNVTWNGVHFSDIWNLNFQKWSETDVFCTFWLGNVLCATTACTFSTSQLPKVVWEWCVLYMWLGNVLRATTACAFSTFQLPKVAWEWCVLYILTWKCASRHNGVQFFISHLASWLRSRCFSKVTFRPSRATNHWKQHSESWLPYLSVRLHLLSSDFLPLWFSPSLIFSSLTLPTSAFPSLHIAGTLTSKLPSIIICKNILLSRHGNFSVKGHAQYSTCDVSRRTLEPSNRTLVKKAGAFGSSQAAGKPEIYGLGQSPRLNCNGNFAMESVATACSRWFGAISHYFNMEKSPWCFSKSETIAVLGPQISRPRLRQTRKTHIFIFILQMHTHVCICM